jgi:hypothetical protein
MPEWRESVSESHDLGRRPAGYLSQMAATLTESVWHSPCIHIYPL